MEIITVKKLNKAVKPYTRTRKGKLEHVSGHERVGLSRVSSAGGFQVGDKVRIWRGEHQGKSGEIVRTDGFHATVRHDDGTFTEEVPHHRLLWVIGKLSSLARSRSVEEGDRDMKKSVMVVSVDEVLKAEVKPYTRTRRGKLERVGEYSRAGGAKPPGVAEVERIHKEGEKADKAHKPDEKEEYTKLKEFESMLNEEGKKRLAELEAKHGEGGVEKKLVELGAKPEELEWIRKHPGLAEHIVKFGEATKKEKEVKAPEKKEAPTPEKAPEKKEPEKKEKPAEGKKTIGAYTPEELSSALGVKLRNPKEKYDKFFTKGGGLNKDAYHGELSDEDKLECLIYGAANYTEHYVEKAQAGDLWKDPAFHNTDKENPGINDQIGRSEGIRRAFIDRAKGYSDPKDKRQALHTAIGYIPKVNALVATLSDKFGGIFSKSEEGLKIWTIDDLYKARTMGARDIKKRKTHGGSFQDVAYGHQLAIAKKTLNMSPAMANIMGGMTLDEAKEFMARHQRRGRGYESFPHQFPGVKYKEGSIL